MNNMQGQPSGTITPQGYGYRAVVLEPNDLQVASPFLSNRKEADRLLQKVSLTEGCLVLYNIENGKLGVTN